MAVHSHQSAYEQLPTLGVGPAYWDSSNTGFYGPSWDVGVGSFNPQGPRQQTGSWAFQLLPHLEQENLWKGTDAYTMALPPPGTMNDRLGWAQANAMNASLRVFQCPSRGHARSFPIPIGGMKNFYGQNQPYPPLEPTQTDYAANGGVTGPGNPQVPPDTHGAFLPTDLSSTRPMLRKFADYKDGQSNVILIGEKLINRGMTGGPQTDDYCGYACGYSSSNVRFGAAPPQRDFLAPSGDGQGLFGASHISSALFAFGDGSVRRVRYGINPNVFKALCWIDDGVSVAESDYD